MTADDPFRKRAISLKAVNANRTYTKQELIEIDDALSQWSWDDRLGDKPKGWNEARLFTPLGKTPWPQRLTGKRRPTTRFEMLQPLIAEISRYVTNYDRLRYRWLQNPDATEAEFMEWYLGQLGDRVLRLPRMRPDGSIGC